jgi:VWFA-related protein
MVFDKQGKFVNGLKREQFTLKVDGKSREISFFELVKAGSAREEAQLAAARGVTSNVGAPAPLDRGRTVFFFLDDFHLSEEGMHYTRKILTQFVERDMKQNDQVAIFSASGQMGFLQQLTDNKQVLTKAISRLSPRPFKARDFQQPPMSEYQALRIDESDKDVLDVYVDALLRENPLLGRERAEEMVRGRATSILRLAASATTNTLATLQGIVKRYRSLPGRKVLFLLSDGFLLDQRNSDSHTRIREATAAAASGAFVIYSVDARGLPTDPNFNASTPTVFDPTGRMSRGTMGELQAAQDGLFALAKDTGGRAFFNSNDLSGGVTKGLEEASVYYLLAWKPEPNEQKDPKQRRLEVSVVGHPEWSVRARSSVGEVNGKVAEKEKASEKNVAPTTANTARTSEVVKALREPVPPSGFPVEVTLNFINTAPKGDLLITSVRMAPTSLKFENKAGVPTASVLLAGAVLGDDGKVLDSFNKRFSVSSKATTVDGPPPDIVYTNSSLLPPGLYQVRVAATDEGGGPIGSVSDWIEIPDFAAKKLFLSSLWIGERKKEATPAAGESPATPPSDPAVPSVDLNIGRRFSSSSHLRMVTFVYNATTAPASSGNGSSGNGTLGKPDLAVQTQVFRDDEPVITDPLHQLKTEGAPDLARIPYAAELNLNTLSPGKYLLQITVIDRLSKTSASQRVKFQVD